MPISTHSKLRVKKLWKQLKNRSLNALNLIFIYKYICISLIVFIYW